MAEIDPELPFIGEKAWGDEVLDAFAAMIAQSNSLDATVNTGRLTEASLRALILDQAGQIAPGVATLSLDTDGVPYLDTSDSAQYIVRLDTDGVPYFDL